MLRPRKLQNKQDGRKLKRRKGLQEEAKSTRKNRGKVNRKSIETTASIPRDSEELVKELSARYSIKEDRLVVAMRAALLGKETFGIIETLVKHSEDAQKGSIIEESAESFSRAMDTMASLDKSDPLALVDDSSDDDFVVGLINANREERKQREKILAECLSVADVSEMLGISRQAIERQRKIGNILALRWRNQWRYPRWQFDQDQPGGVVPGLKEVSSSLCVSHAGLAIWLSEPKKSLDNRTPIDLLRAGNVELVLDLAEEHGHLP